MKELPENKRPIPTFMKQHEYESYLKTLSPLSRAASIGATFAANCAIVFGVSDAERAVFPADKIKLLEWIHEGYLTGEFVPKGEAAYFVQLVEHYAGGKPRPDQRMEVLKACMNHTMAVVKKERSLVTGRDLSPFVTGAHILDPKRDKVLDDLKKLKLVDEEEPWEQP